MSSKNPIVIILKLHKQVISAGPEDIKLWKDSLANISLLECDKAVYTPANAQVAVETIINNISQNKYLFSVLLTCCIKKLEVPGQDVRIGQENLSGGYANRSYDQRFITPFLKRHGYSHCEASGLESGRNFERPLPWDLNYPANPRGKGNRESFLGILDYIESSNGDAKTIARYLMYYDLLKKDKAKTTISPPREPIIDKIMHIFVRHFTESSGQGKARLPVLAIYSIYTKLVEEVGRYQNTELLPLERHTTADLRSGSIGDIQVNKNKEPFEGVEVKSEKSITSDMVLELRRKLKDKKVYRYYILSTSVPFILKEDEESVKSAVKEVQSETGAQIIPNGLIRTLWYYLRLIVDPSQILQTYRDLLDIDQDIRQEMKDSWNTIISEEYPELEQE